MFTLLEEITHLISEMQLKVYSFNTTDWKARPFCNIPISQEKQNNKKKGKENMAHKTLKPQLTVKIKNLL